VGEGEDVGVVAGVESGISPSVALLASLNKEREDCVVIAGFITLTKHTVITTKVPIPRQLHLSFISYFFFFFHKKSYS